MCLSHKLQLCTRNPEARRVPDPDAASDVTARYARQVGRRLKAHLQIDTPRPASFGHQMSLSQSYKGKKVMTSELWGFWNSKEVLQG